MSFRALLGNTSFKSSAYSLRIGIGAATFGAATVFCLTAPRHAQAQVAPEKGTLAPYTDATRADKIVRLPGAPWEVPFRQFAGYLQVDKKNNRNIFYWFVEAEVDPDHAPVAFWTNGGPGCSGLIGFLSEHGPFRPHKDGKTLKRFPYSWNKLANMVYIEAPAGVGFSYSDVASDYYTDDAHTAADNYTAILAFFAKFPHLASRDTYITSESYGGHFMPTLAKAIVDGNAAGQNPSINFKGFLVGNPYNDSSSNTSGVFQTFCGHSVAPKPECDAYLIACTADPQSDACNAAETALGNAPGGLDAYALDFPTCAESSQATALKHYVGKISGRGRAALLWSHAGHVGPYDPCADDELTKYLNQADVITAIHAVVRQPWAECSSIVQYGSSTDLDSMTPIYQYLAEKAPALHITVYSGDDDSVCPTLGSQIWMYDLNKSQPPADATPPWQVWHYTDSKYGPQIGGYHVKWPNVDLVTAHGAGHMVPASQPEKGFALWNNYLSGKIPVAPSNWGAFR